MKLSTISWLTVGFVVVLCGGEADAQVDCNTEGIIQMRDLGLDKDQIHALCPNGATGAPQSNTPVTDPDETVTPSPEAPGSQIGDILNPTDEPEPSGFDGFWDVAYRRTSCNTTAPPDPLGTNACTNSTNQVLEATERTIWRITEEAGTLSISGGVQTSGGCDVSEPINPDVLSLSGNTLELKTTSWYGFNSTINVYQLTYDPASDTWRGNWAEVMQLENFYDPNRPYEIRKEGEVALTRSVYNCG